MLRLIDPKLPVRWIHPVERKCPAGQRTVFHIIPLTVGQDRRLHVEATKKSDGTIAGSMMAFYIDLFTSNVTLIEHVKMPDDSEGSASTVEQKIAFLDSLPVEFWPPIFQALQEISALDAGAEKNFDDLSG